MPDPAARHQVVADIIQRAAALPPPDPAVPVESILAARINGLRFSGGARDLLIEIAARALIAAEAIDVERAAAHRRSFPRFSS